MQKTHTANISGLVFHIDEDAFNKLNSYLKSVRSHFSTEEGCDEILADIEARIAEMLQEKLKGSRQVVNITDVEELIAQLGQPGEISGDEPASDEGKSSPKPGIERDGRRFFRDMENKVLGGVSAGLSAFFDVDVVWFRVAFIVFTFFYGFGPLLYLILWIVVPAARTTADRLAMKGEQINISNIEKTVKEGFSNFRENLEEFTQEARETLREKSRTTKNKGRSYARDGIHEFLRVFVRIMATLIGAAFILAGMAMMIVFFTSLFIGFPGPGSMFPFSLWSWVSGIFLHPWLSYMAIIALSLTVGIPVISMIWAGVCLAFNLTAKSKAWGIMALLLWLAGVLMLLFVALYGLRGFAGYYSDTRTQSIQIPASQTLYVHADLSNLFPETETFFSPKKPFPHFVHNLQQDETGIPRLVVQTTHEPQASITIERSSHGISNQAARELAEMIRYDFEQRDSILLLHPTFFRGEDTPWRNQEVYIRLNIPANTEVVYQKDARYLMRRSHHNPYRKHP